MTTLKAEAGAYAVPGASAELTHYKRLPDHPRSTTRVGQIASDWSLVEHLLDLIIWHLAKVDDVTGACMTGHIVGSFARLTAVRALCMGTADIPERILRRYRKTGSDAQIQGCLRLVELPSYMTHGSCRWSHSASRALQKHGPGRIFVWRSCGQRRIHQLKPYPRCGGASRPKVHLPRSHNECPLASVLRISARRPPFRPPHHPPTPRAASAPAPTWPR